jgi:phage shock protein A
MKPQYTISLALGILMIVSLACGTSSSAPSAPPADTQATVDAAIAATSQAQILLQATVDASVAGTAAAVSAAAPPPTLAATAGPTVEYVTLTEEEMEAMINQAVTDATTATTQVSSATTETTADDTLTQEELDYIYSYYYLAEESLAYADELMDAYSDLYTELAEVTIELLQEVEGDLDGLTTSLESINTNLEGISSSLDQGVALAEETITQLETAAQEAQTKATEAQTKTQNWAASTQTDRDARAQAALDIQPDDMPENFRESLQVTVDFMDTVKSALSDQKISKEELDFIAKLGANASAGLKAFGGAEFQGFSANISEITTQLARGQVPHAAEGLKSFEFSLGEKGKGLPGGLPKPKRR